MTSHPAEAARGPSTGSGPSPYTPPVQRYHLLFPALVFAGCVGSIGDVADGPVNDGTDPGDPRLDARAWRLTPEQYNAEVQQMFPGAPAVNLPLGASEFGLTNISETARIDLGNVTQFTEAARAIGTWAAEQGASAARCDDFGTSACVDTFLGWFPSAAFRRPVTTEEVAGLRSLYDDLETQYDATWAFSALVRAVLLSPHFLYRYEVGPDGEGVVTLQQHEIATLLGFAITGAGPDEAILADAADGRLADADVREAHVRRLWSESSDIWQRFFWEWLKMSTFRSQANETGLDEVVTNDLEDEYRAFVHEVVVEGRGSLSTLLTTNHTWGTAAVADYYGATHPGGGVAEIELDPEQRGGLLTLGAWLVAHGKDGRANVVRRGMAVYRDAMCNGISPLDIDLEEALKELVGADATVKEIADARSADKTCGACHRTSDPVGIAFETYGGNGRWQETYADGNPVEAEAVIDGVTYSSAVEVSAALAEDESFRRCLVKRFGHFVMGAEFGDTVSVRAPREAYDAFEESGGSFEELLVAIVRDPAFVERRK